MSEGIRLMSFFRSSIQPAVSPRRIALRDGARKRAADAGGKRWRACSPPIDRGGGWAAWLRKAGSVLRFSPVSEASAVRRHGVGSHSHRIVGGSGAGRIARYAGSGSNVPFTRPRQLVAG
jgi:hypothetical protein